MFEPFGVVHSGAGIKLFADSRGMEGRWRTKAMCRNARTLAVVVAAAGPCTGYAAATTAAAVSTTELAALKPESKRSCAVEVAARLLKEWTSERCDHHDVRSFVYAARQANIFFLILTSNICYTVTNIKDVY